MQGIRTRRRHQRAYSLSTPPSAMPDNCGYCGDPIPEPPHVCWLAGHYSRQESLEPEPVIAPLEIGWTEGDALVPVRVKQVDISNF